MKHTLVLVHGISDGEGPYDFKALWSGLAKAYESKHKVEFDKYFAIAPVEWDSATDPGEANIFKAGFEEIRNSDKNLVHGNFIEVGAALINTRAWRYFSTFLVGDVIAYIDESDNKIREFVWSLLKKYLVRDDASIKPFSFIGHSLGSVIAYDFVFSLMVRNMIYDFVDKPVLTEEEIKEWQSAFTNLYTLGSPIGLFMMRKRELWQNEFAALINPVDSSQVNRVWLNIWDKEDLVAYPLERIFEQKEGKSLKDVQVDTGRFMPWAHTEYWGDQETATAIAGSLPSPEDIDV